MKRILLSTLALLFPWAIFLMEGKLGLFICGMALQVTLIGWIPMSIVAWKHRANLLPSLTKKTSDESSQHVDDVSDEME